jgi:peptidoglycan/xylan/chitin deacetylase (PgdA/CDA1 family)
VLIISILLSLFLLLGTLPASNAQVTTGAQVKRVMFRDDDVTPGSLGALKAVNQVHIDEGVPVTLGVIPARSFPVHAQGECGYNVTSESSSKTLVEYLQSLAPSGLFELAQHGYGHCNNSKLYGVPAASEFRGMPYSEQLARIAEGRSLMESAFGAAPTTFIPPFNTGDENTLKAISELGFTVYSSYTGELRPTSGERLTLKPQYLAISENDTFESLARQTEPLLNDPRVNDIVVTYHNSNFAVKGAADVNATKVEVLREYIQYLKAKNVTFALLNGTQPSPQVTASPSNVASTTGTQPSPQVTASPSNVASTSTFMVAVQRAGAEWLWAILALAAPLLVAALLSGLMKQVK